MRKKNKTKIFFRWLILSLIVFCLITGFVFFKKNFPQAPVSKLANKPKISKDSQLSKNLEEILKKNGIGFSTIQISSNSSILVNLAGGEEVFFSEGKPFDNQVSSLQFILSRLTIEGKRFSRLDFRFDKPVVTFK